MQVWPERSNLELDSVTSLLSFLLMRVRALRQAELGTDVNVTEQDAGGWQSPWSF